MNEDRKIFVASNLKYLRTIKGDSQDSVGKIVDKTSSAIGYWENGLREPTALDTWKLAEYFNVPFEDFVLKDLRFEENVELDKDHKLDLLVTEKAKQLSEEEKKFIINTIDMINNKKD